MVAMRPILARLILFALAAVALGGCVAAAALAGAEASSVAVFGRGIADLGVSAVTGKDCSIVRLDRGQDYCAPREALPGPPAFCTRTLGTVQCWANPEALDAPARPLADTPPLTAEQVRQTGARWPKSLNLSDSPANDTTP